MTIIFGRRAARVAAAFTNKHCTVFLTVVRWWSITDEWLHISSTPASGGNAGGNYRRTQYARKFLQLYGSQVSEVRRDCDKISYEFGSETLDCELVVTGVFVLTLVAAAAFVFPATAELSHIERTVVLGCGKRAPDSAMVR
jgi:hypothetical protein